MARIVILSVLVLAALCQVYGAQQKRGYGSLLQEVRRSLFKRRDSQLRSEDHYWCWDVLEQHRESVCYVAPPTAQPPQPTHNHDPTTVGYTKPHPTHNHDPTTVGYTKPHPTHKQTDYPHKTTDYPHKTTDYPHKPTYHPTDFPHTHGSITTAGYNATVFAEFVGAREAKGFLGKNIQDLHEECCYEGCNVEEVRESCWYTNEESD